MTTYSVATETEPENSDVDAYRRRTPLATNERDCDITPRRTWYLAVRPLLEWPLALVLSVALLPVVAVAALLVKLTSRGPAFYCQTRLGRNGRPFTLVKLRTMVNDAESRTGPVWASKNDSRVPPLGRFLRSSHIDEFPQLCNVLLGQMSLIGPRPERPEFVGKLDWQLPGYSRRLLVRPGITGLAQLKLPPDSDLASVARKLVYDFYYVKHVGPWLDLKILLATTGYLFATVAKYLYWTLRLPTHSCVERGLDDALSPDISQLLRQPEQVPASGE